MPYLRPTLTQLRQQAISDITSGLPGLAPLPQGSVLRILAQVEAGMAHGHYGYQDWIARQAVPFTATDEYLFGWAALKGITLKDASVAAGAITITGSAGAVPVAAVLSRDDGVTYTTMAAAAVVGGAPVTVGVACGVAGSTGNAAAGTVLTFASPIGGIDGAVTISTAATGGADQESQDSLRSRMLQAYAAPPHGGNAADYVEWALTVPGVTRAWVAPNGAGAGTVVVYPMFDVTEAGNGGFPVGTDGVASGETRAAPATGDQLAVANAIFPQRPASALVYATSPVKTPVPFTVANLGSNNTAAMQAAITAALQGMFLRQGNVGGTVDPSTMAAWPAIDASAWYEALGAISGLNQFSVTTPSAPLVPTAGELFVLGTVTFVS